MPEQLELHTPAFETHRTKILASLLGQHHRHPWLLWDGHKQSAQSLIRHVAHRDALGDRFVRETSLDPDVQL